jgi:NTP pyrophosphatase (non-canonical NTP hydrolase)
MEYHEFVSSKCKKGKDIIEDLSHEKAELLHMAIGVSGEAGELLDAIKKHCIYNKEIDFKNVVEELGDIEFYLQGIRSILCVDRIDVINQNIDKLSKRYVGGYSNKQAQERNDKY